MSVHKVSTTIEEVDRYLNGTFSQIEGWCSPHIWQTLEPLMRVFAKNSFCGPIAEIGPYHGKFFWGLTKSTPVKNSHCAIDIFDKNTVNQDNSGVLGNKDIFLRNGEKAGERLENIKVITQDTEELISADILAAMPMLTPEFSFFSVDGCHLKKNVKHDILLAFDLTHDDGVIILDDYGNPRWHGVIEAVAEIYLEENREFVPLAYSCNKLLLCHRSRLDEYRISIHDFMAENFKETKVFETERYGWLGLTILPDFNTKTYTTVGC